MKPRRKQFTYEMIVITKVQSSDVNRTLTVKK